MWVYYIIVNAKARRHHLRSVKGYTQVVQQEFIKNSQTLLFIKVFIHV